MKKAFTMIELVFVIVILGILASVAIPKISATRDDAILVKLQTNVKVVIDEIRTRVLSEGKADKSLVALSPHLQDMINAGAATVNGDKVDIKSGKQANCMTLDVNKSGEVTMEVTYNNTTDRRCKAFQKLADLDSFKIKIRGTNVIY